MNLIFDFDGTICDSFEAMFNIYVTNFPELYTSTLDVKKARNIGIKKLIKMNKLSPVKVAKILAVGRKQMGAYLPTLKAFPKFKEVAKTLSQSHTLGILTTNSTQNVIQFLRKNQMEQFFSFVYSERSLYGKSRKLKKLMKKYNLNPADTFYIGDETRDMEAAKEAGVKSVAVAWGVESQKLLQQSNPDIILNNPKGLLNL